MSSSTTEKRFSVRSDARWLLAAVLATALGCSRREEPPDPPPAADDEAVQSDATERPSGESAPPDEMFEVVTAEALIGKLRASGRKGTLVNAWASFCGPCKREIPMLEAIARKFRPHGIDVVLVSVDEPTDRPKAEAFLRERGIGLRSYLAARPLGAFKSGMNPRWPGMLPASFLFDSQGSLLYYWGGEAFENEVSPVLEALSEGKALEGASNPLVVPEAPEKK